MPVMFIFYVGVGSNFFDGAHDGCKYKAVAGHERCPTPSLMEEESEDAVVWQCDDGFEAGSKCVKHCNTDEDWMMKVGRWADPKVDLHCYCKGTCKWKGTVNKCSRMGCTVPPPVLKEGDGGYHYEGFKGPMCDTASGQPVDYDTTLRYST